MLASGVKSFVKKSLQTNQINLASRSLMTLTETLMAQVPEKQKSLAALKKEHGSKVIGEVTVDQCIGGARGVKCMLWETSNLDAEEGIRFRGLTIPDCQKVLPTFSGTAGEGEPMLESLLWLLLTSEVPNNEQVASLTKELHERSELPAHVITLINSLPKDMHPMTQMTIGLNAAQTGSKFAKAYGDGVHKSEYHKHVLEDILDVIAILPEIAAQIYRNVYFDGVVTKDHSLDYSGNFCRMLGYDNPSFDELMRLYLCIHTDHEGGNASAHATHLVGSTLSDPYLAYAGGLNALAGPLHGLANQEVLKWIQELNSKFGSEGKEVNAETITEFAWDTLNAGKVIPGYGHAVLRKTDPRYTCQREFALKHMPDDELFKVVDTIYSVMPGILTEHGKTANPYPNVDSHSGVLLWHYGFTQYQYYTVLFGVSRAVGALSQLYWDRALGLPLERPKSVTPEWIAAQVAGK
uniref:Citrate synthase n=1 Tax=Chaetoceros debilis TaxID=122233 RepID=A0A7S3Q5G2_9STRA|mmetsp:Transcript_16189/g.24276  ORF Transcript_16189/g.24276 Transcript_16189/m.24276 type:complete len:465 (-) Transcript_16189:13-1407(-)|eukprot:CAMPEP_0194079420 /NCGR_PEP_ID=MMETSP0149-20130528/5632_1 /TAXON_ID=122233 /ORGANISM="Chaetoceros debilis, Strain MM31A-1" /LENGTH=464 /DNA_ID=CAMNT_0038760921 /DNA_START=70 /DNA_END=1464 /DNA_ORIENTATION=+